MTDAALDTQKPPARAIFSNLPTASAVLAAFVAATPPVVFLIVLVVLWSWGSAKGIVPFYIIPGPEQVAAEFMANKAVLLKHATRTTLEALAGFSVGNIVAVVMAILLTWSRPMKETFYPFALLTRAVPVIVFTPLIVVMLGRGLPPIIFTVALTVYFPTFLNMIRGLRSADAEYHETLHTLSATRLQRLWLVDFPSSMPYLFAALKISASGAFISALVAEWIGSNLGLGYLVVVSGQYFKLATLWAAIFTAAFLTLALLGIVTLMEALLGRWTAAAEDVGG
ncbi:ABC transporter permease [Rhizobium sp. S152]|uniref:ABC transporter permease n=1 Tax=Rhizobium sp. S152 TaxID=3055038 RepID=UPI0025AA04EE|nr:ABC transporter permease [Rhizobium sp. S152]MDM9627864.1 ABC transporter permease [Rhizobium sp. S152]